MQDPRLYEKPQLLWHPRALVAARPVPTEPRNQHEDHGGGPGNDNIKQIL